MSSGCGFCAKQKKTRADRFAYSDSLKGRSSGVILAVASQFASVDTIPNAVRSGDKNSSRAPAELVRMVSDF